jgi:hypothetical protein
MTAFSSFTSSLEILLVFCLVLALLALKYHFPFLVALLFFLMRLITFPLQSDYR